MTSGHYGPYALGVRGATMGGTAGGDAVRRSKSIKTTPSADRSLELDSVKLESLVMADQPRRREYVPAPCTHRPSHHGNWDSLKTRVGGLRRGPVTGVKS